MTQSAVKHSRKSSGQAQGATTTAHRPRSKRRAGRRTRVLTGHFHADVRKEARSLGLSTQEYLRLLVALSKSLRQGLLKNQTIDAKALLALAESPVFGGMIQYVAQSAGRLGESTDDESARNGQSTPDDGQSQNRRPDVPQPGTQSPQRQGPGQTPGQRLLYPWPYPPPYPQPRRVQPPWPGLNGPQSVPQHDPAQQPPHPVQQPSAAARQPLQSQPPLTWY